MTITTVLRTFFTDVKFQTALVLVFLDVILGVLAAIKMGTFKLNWFADFVKTDVLFKIVPWGAVYAAALFAGHQQLLIPWIDIGVAAGALYAAIVIAWSASIVKSLHDLGFPLPAAVTKYLAPERQPPPAPLP